MAKDIEQFVSKCEACNTYANEQVKEPMISHRIPKRPWQVIACDLFECQNKDYLITVDYYSDFFEVDRLHSKTGSAIIGKLKSHLARPAQRILGRRKKNINTSFRELDR